MFQQITTCRRYLHTLHRYQRTLLARHEQRIALILLLLLLLGGEPLSCILHCRFASIAAPAGVHFIHHTAVSTDSHQTHAAPSLLQVTRVAEDHASDEGSKPQLPVYGQEHEHLAALLFAIVFMIVGLRLYPYRRFTPQLPMLHMPPRRRPPIFLPTT